MYEGHMYNNSNVISIVVEYLKIAVLLHVAPPQFDPVLLGFCSSFLDAHRAEEDLTRNAS